MEFRFIVKSQLGPSIYSGSSPSAGLQVVTHSNHLPKDCYPQLVSNATVADILFINKVIKLIKSTPSSISIPKLDLRSLSITVFADASFNNLRDGGSQGGYIIFLNDNNKSVVPLSRNSTRLWRVAHSTLAAETLAMSTACDSAIFLSNLTEELTKSPKQTNITVLTDNQSLFETLKTKKASLDCCLRLEISASREMCNNGETSINSVWE